MRFNRRRTIEATNEMLRLRDEEHLTWTEIAKRLNVTLNWLQYRREKIPGIAGRLSRAGSAENIAKARELRAAGVCWKKIADHLGVERWQTIARAVYIDNRTIAP